jgi:ATP synthase protein I
MATEPPLRGDFGEAMRRIAPYLNLGWTFAVTIALGVLGGWWLDRKLGTGPWLLLGGALLGIAAAFVNFFRVVLRPPGGGTENQGGGEG